MIDSQGEKVEQRHDVGAVHQRLPQNERARLRVAVDHRNQSDVVEQNSSKRNSAWFLWGASCRCTRTVRSKCFEQVTSSKLYVCPSDRMMTWNISGDHRIIVELWWLNRAMAARKVHPQDRNMKDRFKEHVVSSVDAAFGRCCAII